MMITNNLWQLFQLQLKEFSRDSSTLFMSFVFPLIFVGGLFLSDMMNPTFKFEFAVNGQLSSEQQEFLARLSDNPSIEVTHYENNVLTAKALSEGKAHVILHFVKTAQDTADKLILTVSERYKSFTTVILDSVQFKMDSAISENAVAYEFITPEKDDSSEFMFVYPGLLALALLQLGLFATAAPLLQARDKGTLSYLLLTPTKVSHLLAAQLTLRLIVSVLQISVLLAAGSLFYDLSTSVFLQVFAVAALGLIMLVSIGYAIAGLAPALQSGMSFIMIANFVMMFGGAVFWDPETSDVLFYVAHFVPLAYLSDLFRQIISGNPGIWPMYVDILVVISISAITVVTAIKTFKFDMTSEHVVRESSRSTVKSEMKEY